MVMLLAWIIANVLLLVRRFGSGGYGRSAG